MPLLSSASRLRRPSQLMLFLALLAWYFVARALAESAANGLAFRFRLVMSGVLLEALFHLFLLVVGYLVLGRIARQAASLAEIASLPDRPTKGREWLTGAALGWGMIVAAILPAAMLGRVHATVSPGVTELGNAALGLAVLAVTTLTHEMAFRGYPFKCLIGAVGESTAVIFMVLGAGVSAWHNAWVPGTAVVGSMLLTFVLAISWLRTRAVWFAWGLHFALVACGSVLFGLPVGAGVGSVGLVRSTLRGPDWLTGGDFGPAGALLTLFVLIASIPVLFRLTREYAWNYTHTPIVAGGYEVAVPPPAAHTQMEQTRTVQAPALVQIMATTPTSFSVNQPANRADALPETDKLP